MLLTNGAFLFLAALGYTHVVQLEQMLRPSQPVSLSHLITSEPWGAIAVLALLVGIVLEAAGRRIAAVVNCAYYVLALAAGIWGLWKDANIVHPEHVTAGVIFYLMPVFIVALADIWLYRSELFGLGPASG